MIFVFYLFCGMKIICLSCEGLCSEPSVGLAGLHGAQGGREPVLRAVQLGSGAHRPVAAHFAGPTGQVRATGPYLPCFIVVNYVSIFFSRESHEIYIIMKVRLIVVVG